MANVRILRIPRRRTIGDGVTGHQGGTQRRDGFPDRRIISSIHPIAIYRDLAGIEHLPDDVVPGVQQLRTRSGSVEVNLALSGLPQRTARDSVCWQ